MKCTWSRWSPRLHLQANIRSSKFLMTFSKMIGSMTAILVRMLSLNCLGRFRQGNSQTTTISEVNSRRNFAVLKFHDYLTRCMSRYSILLKPTTFAENPCTLPSTHLTKTRHCWWSTVFNFCVTWILCGRRCKWKYIIRGGGGKMISLMPNHCEWRLIEMVGSFRTYSLTSTGWTSMLV